ncbi:MAG: LemA family protein [Bacteroidales bacterium]
MKSKSSIIILVIVGIIVVIGLWIGSAYNGLVKNDEGVSSAWAQVENVYQRRSDLIPNLVNTVKGSADFERSTLQAVVDARATATQTKVDPSKLNEQNMAAFEKAQDGLSSALGRLLMVVERYPDLKANQNFRDLQTQLESTENRITVERKKFNDIVRVYNTNIRKFPRNVIAGMFGFDKKAYFKAEEKAATAPAVDFKF